MSNDVIEQIDVAPREGMQGAWTVEAIGSDGEIYQAIFLGPEAESRAHEYARLKYGFTSPQPRHR